MTGDGTVIDRLLDIKVNTVSRDHVGEILLQSPAICVIAGDSSALVGIDCLDLQIAVSIRITDSNGEQTEGTVICDVLIAVCRDLLLCTEVVNTSFGEAFTVVESAQVDLIVRVCLAHNRSQTGRNRILIRKVVDTEQLHSEGLAIPAAPSGIGHKCLITADLHIGRHRLQAVVVDHIHHIDVIAVDLLICIAIVDTI